MEKAAHTGVGSHMELPVGTGASWQGYVYLYVQDWESTS